jgi:hypothetical protein
MFTSRAAYRISLLAALIVIALTVYGQMQGGLAPCGTLSPHYATIIAFELARSVGDLQAIFGDAPSTCREKLIASIDYINWADNFAYIPAYGLFLLFFFLGARARDSRLATIGLFLTLLAAVSDYGENYNLFQLTGNLDTPSVWLFYLPWATGAKWVALAAAGTIGGAILAKRGGFGYAAAVACALGFAIVVLATIDPHGYGAQISNGILLSWIVFLIVDVREAFRATPP